MNLSTPFSVNIISQMRAKQWRRPEEELGKQFSRKKEEVIDTDSAAGELIDGEPYTGFDYDVCRVMLMEMNGITRGYVNY